MKLEPFLKECFNERNEKISKIKRLKTSGNLTFLIFTDKSKYILRLCGTKAKGRDRTHKEILSEIKLLNFLFKNRIPVPNPIKLNNKFVISRKSILGGKIDKRHGICYEYLEKRAVKNPSSVQCFAVGEILGKIHNLTSNFKCQYKRRSWDLESTKGYFKEVKDDLKNKFLQKHKFVESIETAFDYLNFPEKLPSGVIHEDLGKRHVLFKNNKISGILDWDRSYYGKFILDLGQAIRGWCFDNWKRFNKEKFYSVLRGYESQRKLTSLEKKYLLKSIKFAFIERALSYGVHFLNNKKRRDGKFAITSMRLALTI